MQSIGMSLAMLCGALACVSQNAESPRQPEHGCDTATAVFRAELEEHQRCSLDSDCAGGALKPLPGACCYVAARAWWRSEEMNGLLDGMARYCGRATYACYTRRVPECLGGHCQERAEPPR